MAKVPCIERNETIIETLQRAEVLIGLRYVGSLMHHAGTGPSCVEVVAARPGTNRINSISKRDG